MPEAPYFFPDWPLYYLSWIVSPNYSTGLAVFTLLQMGLFSISIAYLVSRFTEKYAVSTLLSMLLIVPLALLGVRPAETVSTSFFRFGSVILLCFCLGTYLRVIDYREELGLGHRRTIKYLAILFVLVLFSVASDMLMVIWFSLPIVAAEIGQRVYAKKCSLKSWKVSAPTVLIVLGSSALGLVLPLTNPSGEYAKVPNMDNKRRTLSILKGKLLASEGGLPWIHILVFVCLASLFVYLFKMRRASGHFILLVWLSLSMLGIFAAETSIGGYAWRYHLFVFFIPLIFAPVLMANLMAKLDRIDTTRFLGAMGSIAVLMLAVFPLEGYATDHTLPEVACLDQVVGVTGSREGVGNYGAARLAFVQSQYDLKIGSRNVYMHAEADVHSLIWADDSADFFISYFPVDYSSVHPLLGDMSLAVVRALAEKNPIDRNCGDWTVLDFGPGGIDLDRLDTVGGEVVVQGCWLDKSASRIDQEECALPVPPGDARFVGFGSYFELAAGVYEVEANIEGIAGHSDFEAVLWNSTSGVEYRRTSVDTSRAKIVVEVEPDGPPLALEPRILVGTDSELSIQSYTIRKVD